MHLTNYAVNKHSKDFIRDEETGSKRLVFEVRTDPRVQKRLFKSACRHYFGLHLTITPC